MNMKKSDMKKKYEKEEVIANVKNRRHKNVNKLLIRSHF